MIVAFYGTWDCLFADRATRPRRSGRDKEWTHGLRLERLTLFRIVGWGRPPPRADLIEVGAGERVVARSQVFQILDGLPVLSYDCVAILVLISSPSTMLVMM